MDLFWLVALLPVSVAVIWKLMPSTVKHERREPGTAKKPIEYNLKPLVFLDLSGWPFAAMTWFVRVPIIGKIIVGLMIRKSKIDLLRHIQLEDCPTIRPLGPLPSKYPVDSKQGINLEDHLEIGQNSDESGFKFITITDLYNAYRSNKVTPLEVVQRALKAIEDMDKREPKLRAFVQVNKDEVLKMATSSTERYTQNDLKPLSFLDGIPVAVKEEYDVVPYHTRNGTTFMGKKAATRDACVVKKLRDAGAVILGITNMHEVGIGTTGNNINRLHGIPRNPYNTAHYTGGSSSGSASAVAMGVCPIAIGSDGGGSVRIPAAACGIVGLKASYGRISCNGMTHLAHSVSHAGPICSNVRDAALVYAFLAGPDEDNVASLQQPHVTLDHFDDNSLKGLRLGVDWVFFKDADFAVTEECEKALKYLKTRGAEVVSIQIPELEETRVAHVISIGSEMAANLQDEFENNFSDLNPNSRFPLAAGRQLTAIDYYQAQKQRTRTMKFLRDIFEDQEIDCIITPGLGVKVPSIPDSALSHGEFNARVLGGLMRFCQLGNLAGIPGITLPVGYDDNGLPISLQVMSAWWQEHVMIRVAMAAEGYINRRRPEILYHLLEE